MWNLLARLWGSLKGEKKQEGFRIAMPPVSLAPGERKEFEIKLPIEAIGQQCFVNLQLEDGRYIRKEILVHPDGSINIEINDTDEIIVTEEIKNQA